MPTCSFRCISWPSAWKAVCHVVELKHHNSHWLMIDLWFVNRKLINHHFLYFASYNRNFLHFAGEMCQRNLKSVTVVSTNDLKMKFCAAYWECILGWQCRFIQCCKLLCQSEDWAYFTGLCFIVVRMCTGGCWWMNQRYQIELIALLPAQWTPSGTQESKELRACEYITESD